MLIEFVQSKATELNEYLSSNMKGRASNLDNKSDLKPSVAIKFLSLRWRYDSISSGKELIHWFLSAWDDTAGVSQQKELLSGGCSEQSKPTKRSQSNPNSLEGLSELRTI